MTDKLDGGQKSLLSLIARSPVDADGWGRVSAPVYPLLERIPADLVELVKEESGRGKVRLTDAGVNLIEAMRRLA